MVRSFKHKLRNNKEQTIVVRINSYGGSTHAMNTMSAFLYFLIKYRKRNVIIEIEHVESAALMFAVNFPHRRVAKRSIGSIHLPVLRKGEFASETEIEEKRKRAINFFVKHTKLQEKDILMLNGMIITAAQMLEVGIATELVETFSPIAA